jgi:hypothetical protein
MSQRNGPSGPIGTHTQTAGPRVEEEPEGKAPPKPKGWSERPQTLGNYQSHTHTYIRGKQATEVKSSQGKAVFNLTLT